MEVKIYADILFLVNFVFDFCLISLTSALLYAKPKLYRLIISAVIGAIYSVFVFFASASFMASTLLQIAIASIMTVVTFGFKNMRAFLKQVCVFYLTAISAGGICFYFFSSSGLGSSLGAVYSSGILYINISTYKLILVAVVLYLILRTAMNVAEKSALKASKIKQVNISAFGKILTLSALYDTGNFLSDSKTGLGVCIAEWSSVSTFFPDSVTVYDAVRKNPEIFKIISCRGIGGEQQLYSFYADVTLFFKSTTTEKIDTCKRLIAIVDHSLTNDQKYSLILPNDFEGANINDGTSFKRYFRHSKNQIFTA